MTNGKTQYQSALVSLAAAGSSGDRVPLNVNARNYLKILEADFGSRDDIAIQVNDGAQSICFKGFGLDLRNTETITKIEMINLNASANQVILGISNGIISDDRANIDASIVATIGAVVLPAGVQNSGNTTLAAAGTNTTQIIAANSARQGLIITNPSTSANPIWIQETSVGSAGIDLGVELGIGEKINIGHAGSVDAWCATAETVSYYEY